MLKRLANRSLAPRRLNDFIRYTQRFRLAITILGAVWFAVFHLLGLTPEAGEAGTLTMGLLTIFSGSQVLILPRLARWWVARELPIQYFYKLTVLVDTVAVCGAITATGGAISIAFGLFYFLAVGNCYMFDNRELVISNTVMSAGYVVTLLLMPDGQYAPKLLDWVDVFALRIPLIYLVSAFTVWVAQRGLRAQAEDQSRFLETLQGFLTALEARDGYTRQHSLNVARWSVAFGRFLGKSEEELEILLHAGELHDIGKIGVPDEILNKPEKLTEAELQRMQEHPVSGVEITRNLRWFTPQHLEVVRHHHERWDGKGYPDRLAGGQIPALARVLALCDVFDAVTNHRPYRQGWMMSQAFDLVRQGRGTQFDPELADQFLAFLGELLMFLREHLPATNFRCATWRDDVVTLQILTPTGTVQARIRWDGGAWVWMGLCEAEAGVEPVLA